MLLTKKHREKERNRTKTIPRPPDLEATYFHLKCEEFLYDFHRFSYSIHATSFPAMRDCHPHFGYKQHSCLTLTEIQVGHSQPAAVLCCSRGCCSTTDFGVTPAVLHTTTNFATMNFIRPTLLPRKVSGL